MTSTSENVSTIGLVEVPALGLYDEEGNNWTALYRKNTLLSKQVLMADLQAGGFDAQLVNLKDGDCREP
ncbi:MAG: radical SAM protein, partial [Limnoraphis robusta]